MQLNTIQKKQLKAKAHTLKPIIYTGLNGFTENVKNEINRALDDHELIKIRMQENDREIRRELFQEICTAVSAEAIQLIGATGIIYRKNPAKKQPAAIPTKNPSTKKEAAKRKLAKKRLQNKLKPKKA